MKHTNCNAYNNTRQKNMPGGKKVIPSDHKGVPKTTATLSTLITVHLLHTLHRAQLLDECL